MAGEDEYLQRVDLYNMGGKSFIMGVWQTGVTWAPTPEQLNTNCNGALEYIATNFPPGPVASLEQSLATSQILSRRKHAFAAAAVSVSTA